jgi:hypothetical protein
MDRKEKLKHINLLEAAKREDKINIKFKENFELQTSMAGDYWKPKAIHDATNWDETKFKALSNIIVFPVASDPVVSEPKASEPVASDPVASEPEASEPVVEKV